jgi:hypothetical protein
MRYFLVSGNEQQRRAREDSSVFRGVPCVRFVATCYILAVTIGHRRFGFMGILVGQSSPRFWPAVVAGAAARSDRLWQFSLSIDVVVCWERDVDFPLTFMA